MDEEQLKILYSNYGKGKGFTDYGEFKSLMDNDDSRKIFFESSNEEMGFKDFGEFDSLLGKKKEPTIPPLGQAFKLGGESTPQLPLSSTSKLQSVTPNPKNYGLRNDGSRKGRGFFGELPNKNGDVSTELSIGVDLGKGEQEIPTLVPTLTPQEKDWLIAGNNPNDKSKEGEAIVKKAVDWHDKRKAEGKSPYAGNESYTDYEKRFANGAQSRLGEKPKAVNDFNTKYGTNYTLKQLTGKEPILPQDETSFVMEKIESVKRGSERLGQMIANTPSFLYDIAAYPQNKIAELTGLNIGTSAKEFAQNYNLPENEVANYYKKAADESQSKIAAKYDKGVTEYFFGANPDYKKGFGLLTNQIAESLPITLSLMMGNAAGLSATASTFGGGVVFGAGKKEELEQANPNMPQSIQVENALGNGLMEGLFEQYGLTKLGSLGAKLIKEKGKDEAKKIITEGFKETYLPILKKYLGIGAEESAGEAATQFAQNVIDKYSGQKPDLNLADGVADAAMVGIGSSVAFSTPTAAAEILSVSKDRKKAKEILGKKIKVEEQIANPNTTPEAKQALVEVAKDLTSESSNIFNKAKIELQNIPEEEMFQLKEMSAKIEQLDNASQDATLDPELKKDLEIKYEEANKQLDEKIDELNKKYNIITPQEITTEPTSTEGIEAISVEEPTDEQIFKDIKDKNFVTFKYNNESEVPEQFKDKISSKGEINGKPFVNVTLPKSFADYELAKSEQQEIASNGDINKDEKTTNEVREVEDGQREKGNEAVKSKGKNDGQKTNDVQNEEVTEGGVKAPQVKTIKNQIADLRAAEQAEYDAMSNPKDKAKREEIYNRYDKLITPLLEQEKAGSVGVGGEKVKDAFSMAKKLSSNSKILVGGFAKAANYTNKDGVEVSLKEDDDIGEINGEQVQADFQIDYIGNEKGKRGKGLASKELDRILAEADKNNLSVSLVVDSKGATTNPIGEKDGNIGLSNSELKKWYESKGFIFDKNSLYGYRPKKTEDASKYKADTYQAKEGEIKVNENLEGWSSPQDLKEAFYQERLKEGMFYEDGDKSIYTVKNGKLKLVDNVNYDYRYEKDANGVVNLIEKVSLKETPQAEEVEKTSKQAETSKPKPENVKAIEEAITKKSGTIKNEIIKEAADPTEVKKILDNLDSIKSKLAGLTTKDGDSVFSEECKWG